jgi:folate-binding Fe-S cluster repair protein YgfZ
MFLFKATLLGRSSARRFSTSNAHCQLRYTPLSSRSVLSLSGPDSTKFLQGLVSNDIIHLGSSARLGAVYAGFFSAPGRVLHDTFIYSSSELAPTYLIDHNRSSSSALAAFMKRYVLRSKVKMGDLSKEKELWAAWGESDNEAKALEEAGWIRDSRAKGMGWRLVADKQAERAFISFSAANSNLEIDSATP